VLSGEIDDRRFLPILFRASKDDDWTQEATWRKANPGIGYSLRIEEMREEFQRAQASDALQTSFRALRLNQAVNGSSIGGWLHAHEITRMALHGVVELEAFRDCDRVVLGLDLGGREDACSLAIVGESGGQFMIRTINWLSRTAYDKWRGQAPLHDFERDGSLIIVDGDDVPHDLVFGEVAGLAGELGITQIAIDPAMSTILVPRFEELGLDVALVRPGALSFTPLMAHWESLIAGDRVTLSADDGFARFCFGNAATEYRGQARMIAKPANAMKIDAAIATLIATALFLAEPVMASKGDTVEVNPWLNPLSAHDTRRDGFSVRGWMGGREPIVTIDGATEHVDD
jgi:phage terminase large subunit-like protein